MESQIVYDMTKVTKIIAPQPSETLSILALLAAIILVVAALYSLKRKGHASKRTNGADHPAIDRLRQLKRS